MSRPDLATLLRERQADRSQRTFARDMGVSPALLSLLLNGKYTLGSGAARRIVAVYPELRPWLARAVLETPADDGLEAAG